LDSISCLKFWGFTKVFCANLHGDSLFNTVLNSAVAEIRDTLGIDVYNLTALNFLPIPNPPSFPRPGLENFNPIIMRGLMKPPKCGLFTLILSMMKSP
jgi:hypothetical protein